MAIRRIPATDHRIRLPLVTGSLQSRMINYLRPEGYYVHIPGDEVRRVSRGYEWRIYTTTIPYFGLGAPRTTQICLHDIDGRSFSAVQIPWCGYWEQEIIDAPPRVLAALTAYLRALGPRRAGMLAPEDVEYILRYIPTYIANNRAFELEPYAGDKPYDDWAYTFPDQPLPRQPVRIADAPLVATPDAITIPLDGPPVHHYFRGDRYPVHFDRIVTPRFTNTAVPLTNPFA